MQVEIKEVTPALAKKWLEKNLNNRNIRGQKVANLARDIQAGRWAVNGDTIRFSEDGVLLDGQHRLAAVVKAGRSITTAVAYGVPSEARMTMDAGAARTAGDQFALRGVKNASRVSTACRYAMSARATGTMRPQSFTNGEIWEFYNMHQGVSDRLSIIHDKAPRGYGNIVAAVSYAADFGSPGCRDEILDAWLYGEGGRDHPCVVARERAFKDASRTSKDGQGLHTAVKMRLVAHGVNKMLAGEKIKQFKIPDVASIAGWTGT